MLEKTASALDFLSTPHKTSAMSYEIMAKQASDEYLQTRTSPNELIAKLASSRGLNNEQIHRVCELTNHQINATMAKSASDQLFTFPVATVEGVFQSMDKGSQAKEAAAPDVELDGGVYGQLDHLPDYVQLVATRRFSQKLASAEVARVPVIEKTASLQLHEAKQLEKRASAEFEYQQLALREHLSRMRGLFTKMASESTREDFFLAAGVVLGAGAAEKLAEEFGVGKITLEGLDKVAGHIDHSHDIVKELDSFKMTVENYMGAKSEMDKAAAGVMDKLRATVIAAKQTAKAAIKPAADYVRPGVKAVVKSRPGETAKAVATGEEKVPLTLGEKLRTGIFGKDDGSMGRKAGVIAAGAVASHHVGLGAEAGAKFTAGMMFPNIAKALKVKDAVTTNVKKSVKEAT